MDQIIQELLRSLAGSDRRWFRIALTVVLGSICVALLTLPLWATPL
jgi:hypothetical protein